MDVSPDQVQSLTHGMRLSSTCHLCVVLTLPWNLNGGLEGIWVPLGSKVKYFKIPVPGAYVTRHLSQESSWDSYEVEVDCTNLKWSYMSYEYQRPCTQHNLAPNSCLTCTL